MKKFFQIFVVGTFALFVTLFVIIGGWRTVYWATDARSKCLYASESLLSPKENFVAERAADSCDQYTETPQVFSIRRMRDGIQQTRQIFLETTGSSDDVLFTWIADATLLVAAPKTRNDTWPRHFGANEGPNEVNGVKIVYGRYPDDPDIKREGVPDNKIEINAYIMKLIFDENNLNTEHVCSMAATINDGKEFYFVTLRLSDYVYNDKATGNNKRGGSLDFNLGENISKKLSHPTSARIGDVILYNSKFNIDRPVGNTINSMSTTTFTTFRSTRFIDTDILKQLVSKLRFGSTEIAVRDWISNSEVIYHIGALSEIEEIRKYDRCIESNIAILTK